MMKPAAKLVLPALIAAEIVLVWSGIMDLRDAVFVVVAVEALLLLVGIGNVLLIVRRYRQGRKEGLDVRAALEDGLALVLPRRVARVVVLEPHLWVCLFGWVCRRTRPGENDFGYHKRSAMGAILPMIMLVSPIELGLVHLLAHIFSPWAWLKWVLLVLGIYAIFWLLSFYASLRSLPHRLEEEGIRLRYGAFAEGFVPYANIVEVEHAGRRSPRGGDGLQSAPGEDALYLAMAGKTDLTLRLHSPHAINGLFYPSEPASTFHLASDEPERLVKALSQ